MTTRRKLLVAGGVAGALGLGALGGLWRAQPRRTWLVQPNPALPERLVDDAAAPHVVVAGGGLAGMLAALTLRTRGLRVTLIEKGSTLGGRLQGFTVRALGEDFPLEHGFHAFFAHYSNLMRVLQQAGMRSDDLAPQAAYPVRFADGKDEALANPTAVWPLNLASVVARSQHLRFTDFGPNSDGVFDLMRYDGDATFAALDGVDFLSWARARRVPPAMIETVLVPFGRTGLNAVERLSAAEAIRFFHFYFLGNPEGLSFSFPKRDVSRAILAPLRAHLDALGVEVRTSTGVRRVVMQDGRARAVELDAPMRTSVDVEEVALDAGVRPGSAPVRTVLGDVPLWVTTSPAGVPQVFDARCTHMGCPVDALAAPADDGAAFVCPCHGGRFGGDGAVLAGPPREPLRALPVRRVGDALLVQIGTRDAQRAESTIACDACILACDVPGQRAIVARSTMDATFARSVAALGTSGPYAVVRFFFDAPTDPRRAPFATTSGFGLTDLVAIYSAFQEPFIGWAQRTGGCVVETHAYALSAETARDPGALTATMLRELRTLLPELSQARMLFSLPQLQDNFSRFAPGDFANRPRTTTPHVNVFCAGDHVRIDAPTALMEAAAMSGLLAANGVLALYGLRAEAVSTVPQRGVLPG